MKQAWSLLEKASGACTPTFLWGDKAYDSDELLRYCWTEWGVSTYAPPRALIGDGSIGGDFRPYMAIKVNEYGRRWHQESLHSAMKRTFGSTLAARTERTMFNEAAFKVLAYAIRRQGPRSNGMFSTQQRTTIGVTATDKLEFKCGSASIPLFSADEVEIKGMIITTEASVLVEQKAPTVCPRAPMSMKSTAEW